MTYTLATYNLLWIGTGTNTAVRPVDIGANAYWPGMEGVRFYVERTHTPVK